VFDVSRANTFEAVKKWKADIDAKVRLPDENESRIPCVLLANKVWINTVAYQIATVCHSVIS